MNDYKPLFPAFGGKSTVSSLVWRRFGNVSNYVEPFFNSGAMLFMAPWPSDRIETVNDIDGLVSNFWRAVQADPEAVAYHADWPVNENDLHARHLWLVSQKDSLQVKLEGDPEFFDAKVAGWWCWGMCCWIGSEFCSGKGPWQAVDGAMVKVEGDGNAGRGVNRKRPHLGNAGRGVNRARPHLGPGGNGMHSKHGDPLLDAIQWFSDRLRNVRVCCGDWSRVCGPTPTVKQGLTAVFLDPPYSAEAGRDNELYRTDCGQVAHDVRRWCLEWGDDPRMRICLCGYEGEHAMPASWECVEWKANGGYGSQGNGTPGQENSARERLYFSPHCIQAKASMFAFMDDSRP